jgi:CubicO group peptidase (beta-lactamase class C family)
VPAITSPAIYHVTRRGWLGLLAASGLRGDSALEGVFKYVRTTTKHGGLVVQQDGRVLFERYFGAGSPDAAPNLASVGKSFTSVAAGMLMHEHRSLFPAGLDTRVYSERLLPATVFPLKDERKRDIRLGHLLTMTSGFRGNSPGFVQGKSVTIDPPGPDGWQAMRDEAAIASDLWCGPGAGYSYATAGVHLVSMMVRHVSGMELAAYIDHKLAKPLGWKNWGYGYKRPEITHTPGGGGIQLRAADILKFGDLMRRGGGGIIPADYVRQCGRTCRFNPHSPYSLQFDINAGGQVSEAPRDAYWKSGSGGHCLYIVPSLRLVIWKLGGRDEQYGIASDGKPFSPADDAQTAVRRTLALAVQALQGSR